MEDRPRAPRVPAQNHRPHLADANFGTVFSSGVHRRALDGDAGNLLSLGYSSRCQRACSAGTPTSLSRWSISCVSVTTGPRRGGVPTGGSSGATSKASPLGRATRESGGSGRPNSRSLPRVVIPGSHGNKSGTVGNGTRTGNQNGRLMKSLTSSSKRTGVKGGPRVSPDKEGSCRSVPAKGFQWRRPNVPGAVTSGRSSGSGTRIGRRGRQC